MSGDALERLAEVPLQDGDYGSSRDDGNIEVSARDWEGCRAVLEKSMSCDDRKGPEMVTDKDTGTDRPQH
ncbi:hypothetical protein [Sporisorium scitamineum]|uniref:Uncharacterized protein n=1 Tax=Sporisorium scitamineum TaxID=49012 RepID=A0A0F7S4K3_9BASI|nr:hypothetical protein [Sporisorium scitamineum]